MMLGVCLIFGAVRLHARCREAAAANQHLEEISTRVRGSSPGAWNGPRIELIRLLGAT